MLAVIPLLSFILIALNIWKSERFKDLTLRECLLIAGVILGAFFV